MPVFEPPAVDDLPAVLPSTRGPARHLFRHYSWSRGRSVLRVGGVYQTVDTPTSEQIAVASEVYLGGHIYTVDDATAAALDAAGYGVTEATGLFPATDLYPDTDLFPVA